MLELFCFEMIWHHYYSENDLKTKNCDAVFLFEVIKRKEKHVYKSKNGPYCKANGFNI
jgi:hypothetical protein